MILLQLVPDSCCYLSIRVLTRSFAFDSQHAILRHVGTWFKNYFTELKTHLVDEFDDTVCVPTRPITALGLKTRSKPN